MERRTKHGWIDQRGLGELVTDWIFKLNLPYKEICQRLKEEHNLELSEQAISNYRKFIIDSAKGAVEYNEEYKNKIAKAYLDTVDNLVYITNKLKEEIERYPDSKEWKQRATFYGELIPIVITLVKRAGEIKPTTIIKKQENIQLNMLQINNIVQTEIVRLIDEGQIPIEQCSDQIKQFYKKVKEKRLSAYS